MISWTSSEADHRTTDICLTPAGEQLAQEAAVKRRERHEQMFSVLSEQEKDTLIELLERINAHWDKTYRQSEGE